MTYLEKNIIHQLLDGLEHLLLLDLVHLDIKPENILLIGYTICLSTKPAFFG